MSKPNRERKFSAVTAATGTFERMERIADAIDAHYGATRHANKNVARDAGCSPATVKNWRQRKTGMHLDHFFALAPKVPPLAALAAEWLGLRDNMDPEFQAKFIEMMKAWSAALDRKGGG